jgi:hypothetical protein
MNDRGRYHSLNLASRPARKRMLDGASSRDSSHTVSHHANRVMVVSPSRILIKDNLSLSGKFLATKLSQALGPLGAVRLSV